MQLQSVRLCFLYLCSFAQCFVINLKCISSPNAKWNETKTPIHSHNECSRWRSESPLCRWPIKNACKFSAAKEWLHSIYWANESNSNIWWVWEPNRPIFKWIRCVVVGRLIVRMQKPYEESPKFDVQSGRFAVGRVFDRAAKCQQQINTFHNKRSLSNSICFLIAKKPLRQYGEEWESWLTGWLRREMACSPLE